MTDPAQSSLAIVLLTWNGREDTLACLKSLETAGFPAPPDAVVVVDNGSEDGTLEAVAERFPWAERIQNGANLGFAGGNNAGLRWALERGYGAVLLLNNDTEVEAGALPLLREALRDPTVGAVQPLLVSFSDPSRIDSSGIELFSLPGARDMHIGGPAEEVGAEPREVFGCCAAAALYRAEALRKAGLLDEDFFVLLEDVDLAFRIRLAGYRALLVPQARIRHKRGISAQGRLSGEKKYLLHRNIAALALRYWPARYLLQYGPFLVKGALWGFWKALGTGRGRAWAGLMTRSMALRRQHRRNGRWKEIQERWMRPLGWGYYPRKVRERLGGPPAIP
jgi:hypothetical protein